MKRIFKLTIIILLIGSGTCFSQTKYSFDYREKELSESSAVYVKNHFLGEKIAMKMQLLRESYTYKVEDKISQRENTIIEKPSIYQSVSKINKYLKKELKKGAVTSEEAKGILDEVLKITLNIRYQNTEALEEELWKVKDPEELKNLYTNRVALNF